MPCLCYAAGSWQVARASSTLHAMSANFATMSFFYMHVCHGVAKAPAALCDMWARGVELLG
jgi:hypothetical protein